MANITINANGFVQHERVVLQTQSHGWNTAPERQLTAITQIVAHHTASGSVAPTLAQVNNWWTQASRRWNRPGYSFLILPNGTIWQLASLRIPTWGAGNANPHSLHIAFAGTFNVNSLPSTAAQNSYGWLVRQLLNHTGLTRVTQPTHVLGHGRIPGASTACPGFTDAQMRNWIPTNVSAPTPSGSWTAGDLNRDVRVTSETLNVRESRNPSSRIVRTLRRGDVVRIRWVLGVNNANSVGANPWGSIGGNPKENINMNFVELVTATRTHTVVSGDTLWGLSQRFQVTTQAIQQANGMGNSTVLTVGRVLTIPNS